MKQNHVSHPRMLVAAAVAALYAVPAMVVQAADIKVDVTGSNIKRIEGEGALPVQVIGRDEIDKSGATSAMEIMNLISANNSAGNVTLGNVIGATTFSNQTASLRGLGGNSTLVLVNGKRMGTFSGAVNGAEGVNLSAIPFAAIERVEVLKDGASAVYGSDAIGGVINFIMRQDYQGAEVMLWGGTPTRNGGGDQYQVTATAGWGDLSKDKWNAFFSVNYQEQKELFQKDRDFSSTNYRPEINLNTTSGQTFPGFISTGGIGNPGFPNCDPSIVIGSRCRFDPARYDGVDALPDHVVAARDVAGVRLLERWVLVRAGRSPRVHEPRQRAGQRHRDERISNPGADRVDVGSPSRRSELGVELGRVVVLVREGRPRDPRSLGVHEDRGHVPRGPARPERRVLQRRRLPADREEMSGGRVRSDPEVVVAERERLREPCVERDDQIGVDLGAHGRVVARAEVDPRVAVVGLVVVGRARQHGRVLGDVRPERGKRAEGEVRGLVLLHEHHDPRQRTRCGHRRPPRSSDMIARRAVVSLLTKPRTSGPTCAARAWVEVSGRRRG